DQGGPRRGQRRAPLRQTTGTDDRDGPGREGQQNGRFKAADRLPGQAHERGRQLERRGQRQQGDARKEREGSHGIATRMPEKGSKILATRTAPLLARHACCICEERDSPNADEGRRVYGGRKIVSKPETATCIPDYLQNGS